MTAETCTLSTALALFSEHLPDIRKACVLNIQALESTPHAPWDIDTPATPEALRLHVAWLRVAEATKPMRTVIKRIDGRARHVGGTQITDADIQAAKDVLIESLYEGTLRGKKRKFGSCPFHNERSPSFFIFPDNRFKCFGCQVHGTAIDFVMLRDKKTFIEAVKTLRGN